MTYPTDRLDRIEQTIVSLSIGQQDIQQGFIQLNETMQRLATSQINLTQAHNALVESHTETDARLDRLAILVESNHQQSDARLTRLEESIERDRVRTQENVNSLNAAVERLEVIIARLLPPNEQQG